MSATVPVCVVYSEDRPWSRKIAARLRSSMEVQVTSDKRRLYRAARSKGAVIVLDLLSADAEVLLEKLRADGLPALIIACGSPRTTPFIRALETGLATLDRGTAPEAIASVVQAAAEWHACLPEESGGAPEERPRPGAPDMDREEIPLLELPLPSPAETSETADPGPYLHMALRSIMRHFGVLRAALFLLDKTAGKYVAAATVNCPEELAEQQVQITDPLPVFLEEQAATVLARAAPPKLVGYFARAGADIVVPLLSRSGLLGWAWLARPSDGTEWTENRRRRLASVLDRLASFVEETQSAARYAAAERALAVIGSAVGLGSVIADSAGRIIFVNDEAIRLLRLEQPVEAGLPVEALGTIAADLLRQALQGENQERRFSLPGDPAVMLLAHAIGYGSGRRRLAALLVREVFPTVQPEQKEVTPEPGAASVDEDRLWEQVADGIAHHIRNPLVAVKTFAQLLPERYEDADFREEFGLMVNREIERLNSLLNSIAALGRPVEVNRRPVDIHQVIRRGLNTALVRHHGTAVKKIEVEIPDHLPLVAADADVLAEAFAQLFANAIEAAARRRSPQVKVSASVAASPAGGMLVVVIEDNGPGIPEDIRPFIFSPFCSTKAHGLGFGLCIARKAVRAHGGSIEITSSRSGTRVLVRLPYVISPEVSGVAEKTGEGKSHETPADS